MDEKNLTNNPMEQADIELEDRVSIPRSRYDKLLQMETKANIIVGYVKAHHDSYKYDDVIKAVLCEGVKEDAE